MMPREWMIPAFRRSGAQYRRAHAGQRTQVLLALAACAVYLSASLPVQAAGFATARFGGEHGNVTASNATALYYNPAGIGFSKGIHLFVDGTLAMRRVIWDHPPAASDPLGPVGADGADYGRAKAFNVFGAP